MPIAFIIVSALIGMFFAYYWKASSPGNLAIKMFFTAYTMWAFVMLLMQLAPLINNGTQRLI
mgnify:CR=1 FL=1